MNDKETKLFKEAGNINYEKLCGIALCNFAFSNSNLIRILQKRGEAIRSNNVKQVDKYNE